MPASWRLQVHSKMQNLCHWRKAWARNSRPSEARGFWMRRSKSRLGFVLFFPATCRKQGRLQGRCPESRGGFSALVLQWNCLEDILKSQVPRPYQLNHNLGVRVEGSRHSLMLKLPSNSNMQPGLKTVVLCLLCIWHASGPQVAEFTLITDTLESSPWWFLSQEAIYDI